MFYAFLLAPGLALAQLQPYGVLKGTVTHISDGDTVRLNTGHTIRLLDINTPEVAHEDRPAQPLAYQAKTALQKLVLNQPVQVQLGARVYDPYDRVLGHIFLRNGTKQAWVNGGMVAGGFAHVYTFPDNRVYGPELLKLEAQARESKLGLWALPRWQIQNAATCCTEATIGNFVLVRGVVKAVAKVGNRTYLNFGEDWRTDFSVVIDDKQAKFFRPKKAANEPKAKKAKKVKGEEHPKAKNPKAKYSKEKPTKAAFNWNDYLGKEVLVRGIATPVNGTMVKITHPEQLQVLK